MAEQQLQGQPDADADFRTQSHLATISKPAEPPRRSGKTRWQNGPTRTIHTPDYVQNPRPIQSPEERPNPRDRPQELGSQPLERHRSMQPWRRAGVGSRRPRAGHRLSSLTRTPIVEYRSEGVGWKSISPRKQIFLEIVLFRFKLKTLETICSTSTVFSAVLSHSPGQNPKDERRATVEFAEGQSSTRAIVEISGFCRIVVDYWIFDYQSYRGGPRRPAATIEPFLPRPPSARAHLP